MDLMNLLEEKVDVRPAHFYRTGLSESGGGGGLGGTVCSNGFYADI